MALLTVVEPRNFDFTDVKDSGEALVVAAQHIDVSWASHVLMQVRWHVDPSISGDPIESGGTITIGALADGHTRQEPITNFVQSTPLGTVVLTDTDSPPFFETKDLGSGCGMLSIVVVGNQPASAGNLEAKLSVDLVLRG